MLLTELLSLVGSCPCFWCNCPLQSIFHPMAAYCCVWLATDNTSAQIQYIQQHVYVMKIKLLTPWQSLLTRLYHRWLCLPTCCVYWNLVGIKFGDFGQNAIFLTLASFKCGVLRPWPPNVTSPLRCKPSLMVDRVPVVCDFKLREGFVHAIFVSTPSHPCPL